MVLPTASGSAPVDRELPGAKSKEPTEINCGGDAPVGLNRIDDARSSLRSRDSHIGLNLRKARGRPPGLFFVFGNLLMVVTSTSAEEPGFSHLPVVKPSHPDPLCQADIGSWRKPDASSPR